MNGTISEKLATIFNAMGVTVTGAADTADYGKVFGVGSIITPESITPTSSYVPLHVSITSIADHGTAGDETIGVAYFKTAAITAHQTGHQLATVMVRTSLSKNIFDAYGVQSHLTIAAATATANSNAHLAAISGKLTLTSNVTQGWANAGLFIIEGAGTVTEMCYGVSIVQEADATAAEALLHLYNDGTATKGIEYSGNFTKGIDFSAGVFSQGNANGCLIYGDINTTKSITPTDSVIPYQCNITSIADSGTSGDETIGAAYFRTAATTAHQTNHQLATLMVRCTPSKNVWDAYGLQSHLKLDTSMQTTGDNAHLTAISGKITFDGTPTIAKGWITAGLFIVEGTGTCSQLCYGVSIVNEAAATGCQSLLHLNSDAAIDSAIKIVGGTNMTYALKIDGATGAAVVAAGQPAGHAAAGYISVYIGASAYAVPFWAVGDMANS
jgi:hypothetical protein